MEISLGDFILSGGEVAAMAVTDAVVRLLPGALGKDESSGEESFSDGLLEYPQYTRPREFRGMDVPEVLLGGNHAEITAWRHRQAEMRTKQRRDDLWERYEKNKDGKE
jgi:tRNA (guanine37-N1)-methyltransferase